MKRCNAHSLHQLTCPKDQNCSVMVHIGNYLPALRFSYSVKSIGAAWCHRATNLIELGLEHHPSSSMMLIFIFFCCSRKISYFSYHPSTWTGKNRIHISNACCHFSILSYWLKKILMAIQSAPGGDALSSQRRHRWIELKLTDITQHWNNKKTCLIKTMWNHHMPAR